MANIQPGSEIRQAVRWISEQRLEDPSRKLGDLMSEASRRFNLTPKQEVELFAFLRAGSGERRKDAD